MKKTLITLTVMGLSIFGMLKYLDKRDKERKQLEADLFVNQRNYDSLMIDSFFVNCDGVHIRRVSTLKEIQELTGNSIPAFTAEDSAYGYDTFSIRYRVWELSFVRVDSLLALKQVLREPCTEICGKEGDLFKKYRTLEEYKKRFPVSALHIAGYGRIGIHTQLMAIPLLNKDPNGMFSLVEIRFNAHDELAETEYLTRVELGERY